ncbi:MAG TPA: hypothetical protein VGO57_13670 [Verrucomicrobiae bacterium]
MNHRTSYHLDNDAIEAVIYARNHAPLMQTQRDILFKLTLRLDEEGFFDHEPVAASQSHDQPPSR